MAAVFADERVTRAVLAELPGIVTVSVVNGPLNTTVSGSRAGIRHACREFESRGIQTKELRVRRAGHSRLMEPILDDFEAVAARIPTQSPRIDLICTVTGRLMASEITAAQAFHWFDPVQCSLEFRRIARRGAVAALLWNERRRTATPFLTTLESLLTGLLPEYASVAAHDARLADTLNILFAGGEFVRTKISYRQVLDEDGLVGRVLSASYAPGPCHPLRPVLDRRLRTLHRSHARNGGVHLDYDTLVVQ